MILNKVHDGVVGGHFYGKTTVQNILQAVLWCPTIHVDAREYCHSCNVCQRIGKPSRQDESPLVPKITLQEFDN